MSEKLVNAIAEMDDELAIALSKEMLAQGGEPIEILNDCRTAMEVVGKRFESGEYFISELILAGEILKAISAEVKPLLEQSSRGIEFLGRSATAAAASLEAMGTSTGLQRLHHLFDVLAILSRAPQEERRYLADEWFRPQLDGQGAAVDLVRKLRLAHARRLLEQSDKSISDICYEVGFTNLSNFNRHFRNDAGETPRDYRQRVQN